MQFNQTNNGNGIFTDFQDSDGAKPHDSERGWEKADQAPDQRG
jgi:hypothetical protein